MNMETDTLLPQEFTYRVVNNENGQITVHSNVDSKENCDKWIELFSQLTSTSWIVRRTKPPSKKLLLRKDYVCHHSSFKKVKPGIKKSKNLTCEALVSIVVKVTTKETRKRHTFIKDGLPGIITIKNNHNHSLSSADALTALRPSSSTRDLFLKYFSQGLGITEAINYHTDKMELEMDEFQLANSSLNPKYRTVKYWYTEWRKTNLGPRTGVGVLEKLKEKLSEYEAIGARINIKEDPFIIVIITPVMYRSHDLPYAKDIVFIDSTASCDVENHVITFMLTVTVCGAVPLAVLISKSQTQQDYVNGFKAVLETVGEKAFTGRKEPKIIMTDDSDAERQALRTVFPSSNLLLCSFHIGQAVWRWLCEKKHEILKEHRPILYNGFKKILIASTDDKAEEAFKESLVNMIGKTYPQWIRYIESYWNRKQEWCLAYRDANTHGNQTNNFSEVCVRIYKDIVLSRCKAYNVVALVDFTCTVLEQYYIRRLRTFANGRTDTRRLFLKSQIQRASYLKKQDIKKVDSFIYKVPSSSNSEILYDVDLNVGFCTCENGRLGKLCKHQAGVLSLFYNIEDSTTEERYAMAVLALGNKANPPEFYAPLLQNKSIEQTLNSDINSSRNDTPVRDCLPNNSPEQNTPSTESVDDKFKQFLDLLTRNHEQFGSSEGVIDKCLLKLKNVRTRNNWDTFLSSCGYHIPVRKRHGTAIRVQPTTIARRNPGVTRGSKRMPTGRPASNEFIKRKKRKHNLASNVSNNVPHAKGHGSGH